MVRYESQVKQIYYPVESVYRKASDLNNLAIIKERINDPMVQSQIPADKVNQVREAIENIEFNADTLTFNAGMVGNVSVEVVEREENRCVKFASVSSPVKFTMWMQMLPTGDTTSKIKLTLDADLNFFMKKMIDKQLSEGIDRFADMLAMIPYN